MNPAHELRADQSHIDCFRRHQLVSELVELGVAILPGTPMGSTCCQWPCVTWRESRFTCVTGNQDLSTTLGQRRSAGELPMMLFKPLELLLLVTQKAYQFIDHALDRRVTVGVFN